MSLETQRFIASLQLTMPDGTATRYFRDFLAAVDGFIQQAAVVSTWGGIGGPLSDQTDLQSALDGKATSAQGALADSAVQPGDNVSDLTNDANYTSVGDNVSVFVNNSGYLVPTDNVSELTNDAGYLTIYAPPSVRNEASTPYSFVLGDANTVIRFTAASASVTLPNQATVAFTNGTELVIRQAGTGTLVLTTTGLTINGSLPTWAQHTELKLRKVGTDVWDVV